MASSTMNAESETFLQQIGNFINENILQNPVPLDENYLRDLDLNSQNDNYESLANSTDSEFESNLIPDFELLDGPDTALDSPLNAMDPSDYVASLPSVNPIGPTQNISNLSEPVSRMPMLAEAWMNMPLPPTINDRFNIAYPTPDTPEPRPSILNDRFNMDDPAFMNFFEESQSCIDPSSIAVSPYNLEGLLGEPASTDFSISSQKGIERLGFLSRIPAEQSPPTTSQRVAQKVAQTVAPEVGKKRGPGRPRKNQGASKGTENTIKQSPVTSRKRQRSNIFHGEAEFGNSKLRGLAINKGLDSAGATTSPSDESSNSSPRSTDRDDFVSAPTSSRVYPGKHIPATYSSQRKRKLTPDVSEKLPQSKRRRRQVETTQIPADHPYSTNTITAKHPKSKTNARTTEKKMKVRLPTNNAPKEPAQKQILDPGPLIKNGEKVILRPGYSRVEQKGETKGRRRVFNKPPIQVKYNKAANNLRREQIVMTTKQLLSTNKIIQRRMARFSFLPGVTVQDVNNAWNNWVTIQNDQEEYLKNIRCQKVSTAAKNDSYNKAQLEHILANNGVMHADEPKFSDRLKKINESEIIHEVMQRFSANQGFILFFIEKFKITSPLLSGYVLRNVHPENVSDKVKEIILQGEIARPSPPVKRECKEKNKEVEDTPKYREGERNRLRHNAMERKRRLEQKMCFEVVRLTCPERYNQKKSSIHDILRGLKNTLSMTSTYFYKKIVLKLVQKGYGNLELTKLKRLCKLTKTKVRHESHSSK